MQLGSHIICYLYSVCHHYLFQNSTYKSIIGSITKDVFLSRKVIQKLAYRNRYIALRNDMTSSCNWRTIKNSIALWHEPKCQWCPTRSQLRVIILCWKISEAKSLAKFCEHHLPSTSSITQIVIKSCPVCGCRTEATSCMAESLSSKQ